MYTSPAASHARRPPGWRGRATQTLRGRSHQRRRHTRHPRISKGSGVRARGVSGGRRRQTAGGSIADAGARPAGGGTFAKSSAPLCAARVRIGRVLGQTRCRGPRAKRQCSYQVTMIACRPLVTRPRHDSGRDPRQPRRREQNGGRRAGTTFHTVTLIRQTAIATEMSLFLETVTIR